MEFLNICTKKTYEKKDGTQKTNWLACGTLRKADSGKMFIEMNMFPDTTFFVFEQKNKDDSLEEGWDK